MKNGNNFVYENQIDYSPKMLNGSKQFRMSCPVFGPKERWRQTDSFVGIGIMSEDRRS